MHRELSFRLTVTAALLALWTSGVDALDRPTALPPETLPEGMRIESVTVRPDSVGIEDAFSYRQVLLTARTADGGAIDVTRMASADGAAGIVEVSRRGVVRPLSDGETSLRFSVLGHEVSVPVRVAGVGDRYRVSFVQDVMPAMSKLGCNAGTCHGAAQGKNGFKLSLRGYDPFSDHQALTDDLQGRRFNRAAPDDSLFLLKVSGAVPHVGGVLAPAGSKPYELFRSWVAQGVRLDLEEPRVVDVEAFPKSVAIPLPGMTQQIAVVATYSDGSQRDVTLEAFVETSNTEVSSVDALGLVTATRRGEAAMLVRFEGRYASVPLVVMGDRSGFAWREVPEYNYVDTLVYKKLRSVKTLPSEVATDSEFLRRVFLDLTGLPPSAKQVRTFLMDRRDSREKRVEVIERLLGSIEYVDYWTNKWADLLQVNRTFLGEKGATALHEWIRQAVVSNYPYDDFVYEILTASGSTVENPPAAYYKVLREPEAVMENTTQLFLGVRFNCNKCHDHPFERWTQDNYWELASFFARVGRKNAPDSPIMPRTTAVQGQRPAFEEIIFDKEEGEVTPPYGGTVLASFPYEHPGEVPESGSRRERLARWLASEKNPYFAKSFVNRLWSYFFGIGFIDPVDDIRAGNPPTNPELLDRLTAEFIESGFDVRALMHRILTSRTYQHSVATNEWNEDDSLNFSHAYARRLSAEALYDAIHAATGSDARLPGMRSGSRAAELLDSNVKLNDGFLDLFGKPPRESACECERSSDMSLGQSLSLINGPTVAAAIRDPENRIAELIRVEKDNGKVLEELFLSFLGRMPTAEENESFGAVLDPGDLENLAAVSSEDLEKVTAARKAWEEEINAPVWQTLRPDIARSSSGAVLEIADDGSILASGDAPEKDTYTIVATTELESITGLRLEALTHESLPGSGPGRGKNGEFVVSEIAVAAVPLKDPKAAAGVTLQSPSATYSHRGREVERAIDGKLEDGGWGNGDRSGVAQRAVFELEKDAGKPGGTILTLTLEQQEGEKRELGRFRISVTGTKRPVRVLTVPESIAAILYTPTDDRTPEADAELYRYFTAQRPEMADVVRSSMAQDVAWALVNSPAFLFNR